MEIPRRKTLPHEIPSWVDPQKEIYFVTINCEERFRNQLARLNPKCVGEPGSGPAAGAVFRAIAENTDRIEKIRTPHQAIVRQTVGREARPATPEAGVLPNSDFGLKTILRPVQRLFQPIEIEPAVVIRIFDREQSAENECPFPEECPVFAVLH